MNLSVVILTKNEEKNIKRCIKSVSFADEVIVVDDYSGDKTVETAKRMGARVLTNKLDQDFSFQRNYGLKKAKGKWVLFIDADEEVPNTLKNEIIQVTGNPLNDYYAYRLTRKDILWGKKTNYGEWGSNRIIRLAKKNAGQWKRCVHEYWQVEDRVGTLKTFLFHYPHHSLKEFIKEINFFSGLHAEENAKEDKKSNLFKVVLFPLGKFIQNWILKKGYKDGTRGFIMSLMMSFHSFLSWSELWLKKD